MIKRTTSSGGPGRPNMTQQMARGNSHRGKEQRNNANVSSASQDGWITAGPSSRKTGDLTNFGKIDRTKNSRVSLGPSGSVFASLKPPVTKPITKPEDKTVPISPTTSSIGNNMFSALDSAPERRRSIEESEKMA